MDKRKKRPKPGPTSRAEIIGEDVVRTTLRIPKSFHEVLVAKAAEKGLSLNEYLNAIIYTVIKSYGAKKEIITVDPRSIAAIQSGKLQKNPDG